MAGKCVCVCVCGSRGYFCYQLYSVYSLVLSFLDSHRDDTFFFLSAFFYLVQVI